MINTDELCIVNYCHPNCVPFFNICRLPKEEAFATAYKMAKENPDTTAFYRFADFENYYPRRMKTDAYLYDLFNSLGGSPKERHPLSFVLQGSEYLDNWFGKGTINKIRLKDIPSAYISFTLGDSMVVTKKDGLMVNEIQHGKLIMYTKEMLYDVLNRYNGTFGDFLNEINEKYKYIEAQLWDDGYCNLSPW